MSQWKPGQSGNPKGRPRGAKQKLSEEFVSALAQDWEQHGVEAIARVRKERPDQYLRVIASLVPRDIVLTSDPFDGMSDEDLERAIALLVEELRAERRYDA